jgi:hypothetical protein
MLYEIHTKFHEDCIGVQAILRFGLSNLNICNVGITEGNDGMIKIPSFIKIGTGVQAILRFSSAV